MLRRKTALITGCGQGIGASIARRFAEEGAVVWATSRRAETLEQFTSLEGIQTCVLDVTQQSSVEDAYRTIGDIDILVNNAGVVPSDTLQDWSEHTFNSCLDVNVHGMVRMIQMFSKGMVEKRSGCIINIGSAGVYCIVLSHITSAPNRFSYTISKAAVTGITKSVAKELLSDNVRCNCVCPGTIETEGLNSRIAHAPNPSATRQMMVSRQPIGRLGMPGEVAEPCVWLASDAGAFTTGQCIVIDGGFSL